MNGRPSRRGPYKRWINEDSDVALPRTTKWRRMCHDGSGDNAASSNSSGDGLLDDENFLGFDEEEISAGYQSSEDCEPVEVPVPSPAGPAPASPLQEDMVPDENPEAEVPEPENVQPQHDNQHQNGEFDQVQYADHY